MVMTAKLELVHTHCIDHCGCRSVTCIVYYSLGAPRGTRHTTVTCTGTSKNSSKKHTNKAALPSHEKYTESLDMAAAVSMPEVDEMNAKHPWKKTIATVQKASLFASTKQLKRYGKETKTTKVLTASAADLLDTGPTEMERSPDVLLPFQSARYAALTGGENGALKARSAEGLQYAMERPHGLSLGFNVFSSPEPPRIDDANTGYVPLYICPQTLEIVEPSAEALDDAAQPDAAPVDTEETKTKHEAMRRLLLHNPTELLQDEVRNLNTVAGRVARLDAKVKAVVKAIDHAKTTIQPMDVPSAKALFASRSCGNAAREVATVHKLMQEHAQSQAESFDEKWRGMLADASLARRAALRRMSQLSDDVEASLQEVLLRVTDHVLLGTAEEVERMSRDPTPDGAQLRGLQHRQQELNSRQRQQKAVLVKIAKKAMEANQVHYDNMRFAHERLLASATRRSGLLDAIAALEMELLSKPSGQGLAPMEDLKDRPGFAASDADLDRALSSVEQAVALAEQVASAGGPPPLKVQRSSSLSSQTGFLAKIIRVKVGGEDGASLGLTLGHDSSLPVVVFNRNHLARSRSALATHFESKDAPAPTRLNGPLERKYDLSRSFIVTKLREGSPAAMAGVQEADLLVAANGVELADHAEDFMTFGGEGIATALLTLLNDEHRQPDQLDVPPKVKLVELIVVRRHGKPPVPRRVSTKVEGRPSLLKRMSTSLRSSPNKENSGRAASLWARSRSATLLSFGSLYKTKPASSTSIPAASTPVVDPLTPAAEPAPPAPVIRVAR